MKIAAGEFKAKCLQLMDAVQATHQEIVITKHGRAVARLVPVQEKHPRRIFGCLAGTAKVLGDIVGPTGDRWDAEN